MQQLRSRDRLAIVKKLDPPLVSHKTRNVKIQYIQSCSVVKNLRLQHRDSKYPNWETKEPYMT